MLWCYTFIEAKMYLCYWLWCFVVTLAPKQHLGRPPPHPHPPSPPWPPRVTGHTTKLRENENSTTMYMTLFNDRRDEIGGFESARLWSTTFEAGYQAIVAMLRQKAPIKVQRVARWGWTAPQCSTYLWGALFTLTTVGAGERRAAKCFSFVYTSGSGVKERERERKTEMNKAERCITQTEPTEIIPLKVA